MKEFKNYFKPLVFATFALLLSLTGLNLYAVSANTNSTLSKAKEIRVGDMINDTFVDDNEIFYYKFTIPQNIGNKYIDITLNNDGEWFLEYSLCALTGEVLEEEVAHNNDYNIIRACTNKSASAQLPFLTPGNTYIIKIYKWSAFAKGDFTLSLTTSPLNIDKSISTLKLKKYKKGTKKIIGKTIKNATIKIIVSKKSYTVHSNKKGNFSVKLKKKLKAKQKIKIYVSKKSYKTKKKTFKVK